MISLVPKIDGFRIRWLLLASLSLNLLLVGAAGAVAFRYNSAVPLSNVARIDRGAADRLNRLAETLPLTDAQVIRSELRADEEKVAAAQADLRISQDEFRNSLRAEPFDLDAMRAAMTQVQAARLNFDSVLQDVIGAAAVRMSVVGRNKLADWRAMSANATIRQ